MIRLLGVSAGLLVQGSVAFTCLPPPPGATAGEILRRAAEATGMTPSKGAVLHVAGRMVRELRDLSDRSYPPFDVTVSDDEIWFDPASGIELTRVPGPRGEELWSGVTSTMTGHDSLRSPSRALSGFARWQRTFSAWAVLSEWLPQQNVTVEGRCFYRDAYRMVLRRATPGGGERLVLSADDGLPVALLRREESYFAGSEAVEYLYLNWDRLGSVLYPFTTLRVVAGARDRSWLVRADASMLVRPESAPVFPRGITGMPAPSVVVTPPQAFWSEQLADTVRVGRESFLLVGKSFTSAVALAADTVFILDAPQGEHRAEQDSAWVGRLFPGRHPLVLIVSTDIWPHIAGLRYWVAVGARVITHPDTRGLVMASLDRRWSADPDLLERRRSAIRIHIDTVRVRQERAGGAMTVIAVGGSASEGVLAAHHRDDGFLWASDRVQDIHNPSLYLTELRDAATANGLAPRWTSGPHLGVIPWAVIDSLGSR